MPVFLPKSDFPLHVKLQDVEADRVGEWLAMDLHEQRRLAHGDGKFVLHDGPPYANGDIHIGHALNKVLKDMVVRTQFHMGRDVSFKPGWDCHGLPIEWKVEEEFREAGKDKNADPSAFRARCREFAQHWVDKQAREFERLGVLAAFGDPYLTMAPETEARIVETFHELVTQGRVYRANKPVLWSAAERTALANAETVEQEHDVPTVWVKFPLVNHPWGGAVWAMVWTTTPWSLPGNRAVAINSKMLYGLYDFSGQRVVMAMFAAEQFPEARFLDIVEADDLLRCEAVNPLNGARGPVLHADYVAAGKGSGLVHVGPASSQEDWALWVDTYGMTAEIPEFIGPDGRYLDCVEGMAGLQVVRGKGFGEANQAVIDRLGFACERVDAQKMTLNHSWRSGGLLIENATPQWFVRIDDAKKLPRNIGFTPPEAQNRFTAMLEARTDWLVSRQRMWGTPLAIFADRTGRVLRDARVNQRITDAIRTGGAEAWFDTPGEVFLNGQYDATEWTKVEDILDVWFDSGCVFRLYGDEVADLYLEGSDQHRGWFSSSYLVSQMINRHPPFANVLTHGFVVDPNGKKMSKSASNGVAPSKLIAQYGADVVRLWVASTDYTNDVRVGPKTLDGHAEVYKKLRNTLRYLLGALGETERGYYHANPVRLATADPLDLFILSRLGEVFEGCRKAAEAFDFTRYTTLIHEFCVHDLSSLYFDVRKDMLYCDALDDPRRLAYLEVLSRVFDVLVVLLAPVLVFTAEEAWQHQHGGSVHLERLRDPAWLRQYLPDHNTAAFRTLLKQRDELMLKLEEARKAGTIRSNADAVVTGIDEEMRELLVVSGAVAGDEVLVKSAIDMGWQKCDRCRRYYEVLAGEHCQRCEEAEKSFT